MRIKFKEDWRQWRRGEEIEIGDGVADRLLALGKAEIATVRIQDRETTSMARPNVGRPKKGDK